MPYLSVGSQNLAHWLMSRKNNQQLLEQTEDNLRNLLNKCDVVGLQEAGAEEYQDLLRELRNEGFGVFLGEDPRDLGSRATPIVWRNLDSKIKVVGFKSKKLTRGARIPLGAGPPLLKPKFAHCVMFRYKGYKFNFINIHGYASVRVPARGFLVSRFFKRLGEFTDDLTGPVIIVGDMNTEFKSKWLNPLRNRHFKSLQQERGPVVTHVKNGTNRESVLDDILYRDWKDPIIAERHWGDRYRVTDAAFGVISEDNPSDHHALIGVFDILPRPNK